MPKIKTTGKRVRENILAYILILPSLFFILIFTIMPVLKTLYMSFFKDNLSTRKALYTGISNYVELLGDEVFSKVMKNSVLYAAITVPVCLVLGFVFAVAVNRNYKGRGFTRTMLFYPTVIPMIAVANIWMFMFTPGFGTLDRFLSVFGIAETNWLGRPDTVFWAIVIIFIWKESGYLMIFYLAGLQNISQDYYSAALIDGASYWQKTRYITIPLLMPTALFVFVITMTNSFKAVDHLVVMTGGGPDNASNLLMYYIYETAFAFWDVGKASALTVVMFIVMLFTAVLQYKRMDKKIHYN